MISRDPGHVCWTYIYVRWVYVDFNETLIRGFSTLYKHPYSLGLASLPASKAPKPYKRVLASIVECFRPWREFGAHFVHFEGVGEA